MGRPKWVVNGRYLPVMHCALTQLPHQSSPRTLMWRRRRHASGGQLRAPLARYSIPFEMKYILQIRVSSLGDQAEGRKLYYHLQIQAGGRSPVHHFRATG